MDAPKILHIFDGFRVGGTEIRTCNIINNLGSTFRHCIISINGNLDASSHIRDDIDVEYITPKRQRFYPLAIYSIYKMIRKISPNILIGYEWGAIDWVLVNNLFRCSPTIMTVEGFEDSELFVQNNKRLLIRRMLYPKCKRVVVCSKTLYEIAQKYWNLHPPKLLYIPNGIDCSRFTPKAASNKDGIVKLGIVASLIKLKNHKKLLNCLKKLSVTQPYALYIAGDGPEREKLQRFCNENHLEKQVHFIGHVNNVSDFLRKIDIFCLASITEQMPMAVLEAMATGLPIVSTDVGDVKFMVSEQNRPFIVKVDNDDAYTRAVEILLKNQTLRKTIGEANRHKCLTYFDEKLMFLRYKQLYTECLN